MYNAILADPPWNIPLAGKRKRTKGKLGEEQLPYPTMGLDEICAMPVNEFAAEGAHLWLWTTNSYLKQGFEVMEAWGFKYLAPIHWVKPSGCGNYVIHRTQTLLLGYKTKCQFPKKRYFPNVMNANPLKHSQKPAVFHELIEEVSGDRRLELFARQPRAGWHVWGNEVKSDITFNTTGTFSEPELLLRKTPEMLGRVSTDMRVSLP